MSLEYNKQRHLQLLREYAEGNEENRPELLDYRVILQNQIEWEIRDQFLELLENLGTEKISMTKFFADLRVISYAIIDTSGFLESHKILLSPDKNSKKFGELVEELNDFLNDDDLDLRDDELSSSIEEIYIKMKKICEEE